MQERQSHTSSHFHPVRRAIPQKINQICHRVQRMQKPASARRTWKRLRSREGATRSAMARPLLQYDRSSDRLTDERVCGPVAKENRLDMAPGAVHQTARDQQQLAQRTGDIVELDGCRRFRRIDAMRVDVHAKSRPRVARPQRTRARCGYECLRRH